MAKLIKGDMKNSNTHIDGIGASEALDSTSERLMMDGLDISSLKEGTGVFNYEHKSDTPAQTVGKVLYAKKIYSEADCEDERQKYFWGRVRCPFLYVSGELFDGEGSDSAAEVAAAMRYDSKKRGEKAPVKDVYGFSIEGSKLDKKGQEITSSIARKITITAAPANKTCVAEIYEPQTGVQPNHPLDVFKSEPMNKALTAGGGGVAPQNMSGFAALVPEHLERKIQDEGHGKLFKKVLAFVKKKYPGKNEKEVDALAKMLTQSTVEKAEKKLESLGKKGFSSPHPQPKPPEEKLKKAKIDNGKTDQEKAVVRSDRKIRLGHNAQGQLTNYLDKPGERGSSVQLGNWRDRNKGVHGTMPSTRKKGQSFAGSAARRATNAKRMADTASSKEIEGVFRDQQARATGKAKEQHHEVLNDIKSMKPLKLSEEKSRPSLDALVSHISEKIKKSEILEKPYRSKAQERWAHTKTGREALGGDKAVQEWDSATKGKKLPEKVGKSLEASEMNKAALTPSERGSMIQRSHPDFTHEGPPGTKYYRVSHSPHGVHSSGTYSNMKRLRNSQHKADNDYGACLRHEVHMIPAPKKEEMAKAIVHKDKYRGHVLTHGHADGGVGISGPHVNEHYIQDESKEMHPMEGARTLIDQTIADKHRESVMGPGNNKYSANPAPRKYGHLTVIKSEEMAKGPVVHIKSGRKLSDRQMQQRGAVPASVKDPHVAQYASRFGGDRNALKAIQESQHPAKGPYVNHPYLAEKVAAVPNWSSEPTGTIGHPRISEPHTNHRTDPNFKETDPMGWHDLKHGATKKLIGEHTKRGMPLNIHTSSDLIGHDDYINEMPHDTTVHMHMLPQNDALNRLMFPGNPSRKRQQAAVDKLKEAGIKVHAHEPKSEDVINHVGGPEGLQKLTGGISPEEYKKTNFPRERLSLVRSEKIAKNSKWLKKAALHKARVDRDHSTAQKRQDRSMRNSRRMINQKVVGLPIQHQTGVHMEHDDYGKHARTIQRAKEKLKTPHLSLENKIKHTGAIKYARGDAKSRSKQVKDYMPTPKLDKNDGVADAMEQRSQNFFATAHQQAPSAPPPAAPTSSAPTSSTPSAAQAPQTPEPKWNVTAGNQKSGNYTEETQGTAGTYRNVYSDDHMGNRGMTTSLNPSKPPKP